MVELYNKTQRLPSPSINASAPFRKVSMKQNYHNEIRSATRILKKKKLKINVHRPVGTRVVFDEEGNTQAPLAMLADKTSGGILLDQDIEGVVEDSISSSWKSQGLALLQVECYLMLHSMVVYLSRNLN
ncbi:DEAD-box ATP-dependent RNA helicase 32-like isoform X1 [Gossypium hirsutum]|uniref:DEAD-box ATP-dependent RNA helicase 32-like isoform X1 n=1 Tax=Gossypium hirsutum TaxID=3635 RepID=A0A1U8M0A6_GOSHI|nr:DEAD-box ATP-dependent RNA helicase 32-like isoform X1 [Gossypium hirsutum]XP_016720246.1 DEAD-box ATP-dependent RNA helicase 32-like isoform X1 [Gossypium hirsutum]XP_016720247.1 DEAD-box ATP-dependent RNA helicase 32-like isoform X1 [Gossypium hirsutum]XP_016720249.1 DEAD-box ATP-dependent RNA helicase 32-like isoform X1 [Gossypium hirsutum]XP_016720250.1 DEAD-box ATP-dependent RNA helicase 32-like isoform X1 [Gossypium hirsutum]XP_016720251.1 DEAD-box ATP-dependent RNA helicase 32-like i